MLWGGFRREHGGGKRAGKMKYKIWREKMEVEMGKRVVRYGSNVDVVEGRFI